ncbi:VanZ family protein [Streptomyces sp. NPDC051018]|uniref:VanZ family protein n=1 Tax=Streptomyces sp. NPDC051018 TaxID=3365639 RepID=UPI0037B70E3E
MTVQGDKTTGKEEDRRNSGDGGDGGGEAVAGVSTGRVVLKALIMAVGAVALVAFSAVLAKLTLTPSAASADIAGSNLRPGHSLRAYAEEYTFLAACKQIGGNLLLGAPFGLILPVLVERRLRMVRVVLLTALVMVFVELTQGAIVEGRAFDVDDVFLNTGGALIAYLLLGRRIGHHFHALTDPRRRRSAREGRWSRGIPGLPGKRAARNAREARDADGEAAGATRTATGTGTETGAAREAGAGARVAGTAQEPRNSPASRNSPGSRKSLRARMFTASRTARGTGTAAEPLSTGRSGEPRSARATGATGATGATEETEKSEQRAGTEETAETEGAGNSAEAPTAAGRLRRAETARDPHPDTALARLRARFRQSRPRAPRRP